MNLNQALQLLEGDADLTPGVREQVAQAVRASIERSDRNGAAFRALQGKAKELRKDRDIYRGRWEAAEKRLKQANPYSALDDRFRSDMLGDLFK